MDKPESAKANNEENAPAEDAELVEGIDYYLEDGLLVFTSRFLLKRGYCCDSGCRHCPYKEPSQP